MPGSILGTSVTRVEDPSLLRGEGTYVDNMKVEGLTHLVFVRSPLASAEILSIDTSEAEKLEGVLGVFTAADLDIAAHHGFFALNDQVKRPPLARDRVRFVGEAVVAVVAESKVVALDAAELVLVDYQELEPAVDMEFALSQGAPAHLEYISRNIAAGYQDPLGDKALEGAESVIRLRMENQRVAVVPMEGNAIMVDPRPDDDGHLVTLFVSTQMPHGFAEIIAGVFALKASEIRVVAPHVGGAFGGKAGIISEHAVAFAVARRLGRPVKWVDTRSENMVSMPHGRGQVQYIELGLRSDGTFTGMRCRMIGDAGAYGGFGGGLVLGPTRNMAQGVYNIPKISFDAVAALTNTTPIGAFRGAGRPEAAEFLERVVDIAADELGIDPVEIRRKNLLANDIFPYTTQMGTTYDSGDYALALDRLMEISEYEELRKEQETRRHNGNRYQLGIGVAVYVEITAGGGANEFAAVDIDEKGWATIKVGTSGHGQGHATSFAMIVSDQLGVPIENIRFIQSDTAVIPRGGGTGGSRSLQIGGSAVRGAAQLVLEQAKKLAAAQLEAAEEDITVSEVGGLEVAGVPSSQLSWAQLAALAATEGSQMVANFDFSQAGATFPFGAHLALVEVDIETGRVVPKRHIAVDDCGRILNPLIVQGQQHGGIGQGMAQALWEEFIYDAQGNPLTSTLADYAMPSAAEFPAFETYNTETPTPLNELGAKGIGESGTIGSTPAVHNAVIDALSHLGVRHIEMPCTPQKVWTAIRQAEAGTLPPLWSEPPDVFSVLSIRGSMKESDAASVDV